MRLDDPVAAQHLGLETVYQDLALAGLGAAGPADLERVGQRAAVSG